MASPPNNMLYQEGYFPPAPPAGPTIAQPPDNRRRSSSQTADRYRPRNYSNPPPTQPDPSLLGPYQQPQSAVPPHLVPLPMSNPGSPYIQNPPYPVGEQALVPRVDMPIVPQRQLADEFATQRPPVMYPEGLRRASYDADMQMRRYSHDSRRSDRSRHSHHSHHEHRSRYEDDDGYDDEDYDEERERRHHHKHQEKQDDLDEMEAYRQRKKDRGDNVGRSFGDSLVSVFGQPIKWLIEPRDKY